MLNLLVAWVWLFVALFPPKEELKLKLKIGETYYQNMETVSEITQEFEGQSIKIDMKMIGNLSYMVKEKVQDEYIMDVSYTEFRLDMNMMGQQFNFGGDTGMFADMFAGLLNKPFTVKMSDKGKVSEIEGFEELMMQSIAGMSGLNDQIKEQLQQQMGSTYGKETLKGSFEMISSIFPESSVEVGESWKSSVSLYGLGDDVEIGNEFKLVSTSGEFNEVEGGGKFEVANQSSAMPGMNQEAIMNLNGGMNSSFHLDKETNWVKKAQIVQDIDGELTMTSPETNEPMTIPMKIKSTIVLK